MILVTCLNVTVLISSLSLPHLPNRMESRVHISGVRRLGPYAVSVDRCVCGVVCD